MSRFHFKRQRKVRPCLIFDRKCSENKPVTVRQRTAMFQIENNDSSSLAGEGSKEGNAKRQNEGLSNGDGGPENSLDGTNDYFAIPTRGMFSLRKRNSMKKTPEELAIRMIIIEQTLQTRRNAICKEIERKMYIQGACLEKHRHNLQITHELMSRGLLWP